MITNRERDTVLAALRYWQAAAANGDDVGEELRETETNGGEHEGLTDAEIDELCERINVDMAGPESDHFKLEKLRMVAKAMRDALETAESFMSGFEGAASEGLINEGALDQVRAAIELHELQKLPADECRKLVELLATMTDPHVADDLDGELNAFAQMIDKAKEIVGGDVMTPQEISTEVDKARVHLLPYAVREAIHGLALACQVMDADMRRTVRLAMLDAIRGTEGGAS